MRYTLKLLDLEEKEELLPEIGGKAYNLALLAKRGLNIPKGFVITNTAFQEFLRENDLNRAIKQILAKTTMENLTIQSALLKKMILSGELPIRIKEEIGEQILKFRLPFYAVRSSAPGEDSLSSTFAGVYDSYLGITEKGLFETIKKCWASLYNPSAIFYKLEKGLPLEGTMCVIIQQMLRSRVSGVLFSSPEECCIEAVWGLGHLLVSGKVEPDVYVIDIRNWMVKAKKMGEKKIKAELTPQGIVYSKVGGNGYCLTDKQAIAIAEHALLIEEIFGTYQDIEWALEGNRIFILQSRSTIDKRSNFLIGDALYSSAPIPVIRGKAFLERELDKDGILVLRRAEPRFVPFLKNAKAVICEQGGILNHFAILCRELGIPFLLMEKASKLIKDGEFIEIRIREGEESSFGSMKDKKWIKIMSFIPSAPPTPIVSSLKERAEKLPGFLDKEYKLEIQTRKDGIYISRNSLKNFLKDTERNLHVLYENLRMSDKMSEEQKASLPILAAIVTEFLFERLSLASGGRILALELIKGIEPLYLKLDRSELQSYLTRFGIGVEIPPELKRKAKSPSIARREGMKSLLGTFSEPHKVEELSCIIKILVQAYEAKDLMEFYLKERR